MLCEVCQPGPAPARQPGALHGAAAPAVGTWLNAVTRSELPFTTCPAPPTAVSDARGGAAPLSGDTACGPAPSQSTLHDVEMPQVRLPSAVATSHRERLSTDSGDLRTLHTTGKTGRREDHGRGDCGQPSPVLAQRPDARAAGPQSPAEGGLAGPQLRVMRLELTSTGSRGPISKWRELFLSSNCPGPGCSLITLGNDQQPRAPGSIELEPPCHAAMEGRAVWNVPVPAENDAHDCGVKPRKQLRVTKPQLPE
ncbi:hypothetical protein CB1_001437037 [Camelus ferus]|nr:hypothetical protein CB1_001437037 [Camelus ferus]